MPAQASPEYQKLSLITNSLLLKLGCYCRNSSFKAVVFFLDREAVHKNERSKNLPKGLILFETWSGKFKPIGAPKNSGDFGDKQLRRN